MKIAHVKICNYRNLKDIDIGLSDTVAVIGENNSGKSNFLKAITLPFLTDVIHIRVKDCHGLT